MPNSNYVKEFIPYSNFNNHILNAKTQYNLQSNSLGNILKISMSQAVNNTLILEYGIESNYFKNNNENENILFDPLLNHYINTPFYTYNYKYSQNLISGFFQLNSIHTKLFYYLGLRYEYCEQKFSILNHIPIEQKIKQSLLPSGGISYEFTENTSTSLNYSRSIYRPGESDLNPIGGPITSSLAWVGNSQLMPVYYNSLESNFSQSIKRVSINTGLSYSNAKNEIAWDKYFQRNDTTFRSVDNLLNQNSLMATLMVNVELFKWWTADFTIGLLGNEFSGKNDQGIIISKQSILQVYLLDLSWQLPKKIYVDFSSGYWGPQKDFRSLKKEYYMLNLSIRKKIGENLSLTIKAIDILNSYNINDEFYGEEFTVKSNTISNYRSIYIGFLYNFGSKFQTRLNENLNNNQINTGRQ